MAKFFFTGSEQVTYRLLGVMEPFSSETGALLRQLVSDEVVPEPGGGQTGGTGPANMSRTAPRLAGATMPRIGRPIQSHCAVMIQITCRRLYHTQSPYTPNMRFGEHNVM